MTRADESAKRNLQPTRSTAQHGHGNSKMTAPSSSRGARKRPLQQQRQHHTAAIRLPIVRPQRPDARWRNSTEGDGKDHGLRELAHQIISNGQPHVLGRGFFRRLHHKQQGNAHVLCSGPSDDGVSPPPPQLHHQFHQRRRMVGEWWPKLNSRPLRRRVPLAPFQAANAKGGDGHQRQQLVLRAIQEQRQHQQLRHNTARCF